ncbi:serendipity locus protein alpha [Agrilus planipennis]|uniref:Serendipity locus protein alpha n=1 Tax=Agrilus planipennis TaxID=224129 RepID=A0A7F5R1I8_AGRPL|nr:serendipity locus protein alpha [Agrilus planipennis]
MNVSSINNILSEIQECVKKENLSLKCTKEWMKEICNLEKDLIICFERYLRENIPDKEIKTCILLYLIQQHSILSLYVNIFREETKEGLILEDARNCCKECFQYCLLKLKDIMQGKSICEDSSGSFIKWMDLCLNKLSQLDISSENVKEMFQKCYKIVEEVLCHAMSLAQIAIDEDSRIIKGSSKAVLDVLGALKVEIDKNPKSIPVCNLLIDSCSDELCILERKVNTAVLRLCLKLFSDLSGPLDILERYCLNSCNKLGDNINLLVENFDLHVDRIIQVGLFAIGCSSYSQYVIRLKANLASLEALEISLVPSFLLLLKQPSLQNVKCATLLKQYWISNVKSLKQLIYNIIEPSAFCQVVYREVHNYILSLDEVVNEKQQPLQNISIQPIILQTKVLGEMIKVSLDHADIKPNLFVKYERFKAVLRETDAATEQLLGASVDSNTIENSKRVLKRCKVLLHLIKQIWYCYIHDEEKEDENGAKDMHEYDCVKQLQQKVTENNDLMLTQIIDKGKQLLNERSVMYRTPLKTENKNKCLAVYSSKVSTKRKTPRSCLPFRNDILNNEESFVNDTFTHLKSKAVKHLSSS